MTFPKSLLRFAFTILLLGIFSGTLVAQQNYGKILGAVTDPAGAVIPGAKVTVTNADTHVSNNAETDKDGFYQVLSLPIGNYVISVEKTGFKKEVTNQKALLINQNLRVDLKLQVGSNTETISVEGETTGVETVSPTLAQSITSRPILDLPLNGRNMLDLALLQPGVAPADNPGQGGAASANTAFSVSGGRNDSTTFVLDGGVNNNLLSNGVVYNPTPDAVAEFKILTNSFAAEYGRNGGGIVTVVTKSGTNSFHGSAFEYNRNDAYNANTFFNNRQGLRRNVLKRNQFGATFGGPIMKEKLFFFAAYQGQRQKDGETTALINTFTPAEIQGDFSGSLNKAKIASFLLAHPFFQPNAALAAQGIMDPNKIDPVAQAYLKAGLIPVSSAPQAFQGAGQDDRDEATGKFDWDPTATDKFAVTLGRNENPTLAPFVSLTGAAAPGFPSTTTRHQRFASISYTRVFSPTLLNEFHVTAQRSETVQAVPAATQPISNALGININSDHPTGPSRLTFTGLSVGFSIQGPSTLVDNTFAYTDTVTWSHGNHTMKFGSSFSPYDDNMVFDFIINGSFGFSTSNGAKDQHANFLLGLPRNFSQFPAAPSNIRSKSTYLFAQDEWKVASNLTLSYGLRYEYSTPKLDTMGRTFSVIPGQQSTVFANAPVGLVFPGDKGAPRGANFSDRNDFAPRFGFAWDPFKNGKTSIRGGFGVFYDILKAEDNFQFNGQPPFFSFASFTFPSGVGAGPYGYLTNPFTSTGKPNPFPSRPPSPAINFATAGFLPFGDAGVFFVDPHLRTPYTYQYNLSVQQELPSNMVLQTAYVGTTSHKLTALMDVNPFDPATLGLATPHRLLNEISGNTDNSFSFLEEFRNTSDASYNGLQIGLTKRQLSTRYLGNTYFTLAYTYSHNIDNASGFRETGSTVPFFHPHIFRASTDFDLRHVFSFSGGWDLPFNRGPQVLVKGWSLYPIITYRTGYPLSVTADLSTAAGDPGPSGAGDSGLANANLVGPIQYFDPHGQRTFVAPSGKSFTGLFLFNRNSFDNSAPTPPYGTAARNLLRGPQRTNMTLALSKLTPLYGERVNMELRAEAFNIFNHTQFRSVSTNPDSATFGQVTSTYDPRILQLGVRIKF
jgi:hypothetical protein